MEEGQFTRCEFHLGAPHTDLGYQTELASIDRSIFTQMVSSWSLLKVLTGY